MSGVGIASIILGVFVVCGKLPLVVAPAPAFRWFRRHVSPDSRIPAVWQRARLVPRWWIVCCVALSLTVGACHQQSDWLLSYQLERSFALAVVFAGGSSLDLGTEDTRDFLLDGWSWNETNTVGETFVWSNGRSSSFVFFLYDVGDVFLDLRGLAFKTHDSPPQSVSISVSGTALGAYEIHPEFTEIRVPVPAATLNLGWNEFTLDYAWMRSDLASQKGGRWRRQQRDFAVAWDSISLSNGESSLTDERPSASTNLINQTLTIQGGSSIQYELEFAPGSRLKIKDLLCKECAAHGATIEVFLATSDNPAFSRVGVLSENQKVLPLLGRSEVEALSQPTHTLILRALGAGQLVLVQPVVERPVGNISFDSAGL